LLSSIVSSPALLKRAFYYTHTHTQNDIRVGVLLLLRIDDRAFTTSSFSPKEQRHKDDEKVRTKDFVEVCYFLFFFLFSFSRQ
jgi:hypothetical protein